jgi:hypothetical protein
LVWRESLLVINSDISFSVLDKEEVIVLGMVDKMGGYMLVESL